MSNIHEWFVDPEFVAATERVQLQVDLLLRTEFPDEAAHVLAAALSFQIGEIVIRENVALGKDETERFVTVMSALLRLHVEAGTRQ